MDPLTIIRQLNHDASIANANTVDPAAKTAIANLGIALADLVDIVEKLQPNGPS